MVSKEEIPDHWNWKKIKDIGDIYSGGTPDRDNQSYFGGDIPWLRLEDAKSFYVDSAEENITKRGLNNSSAQLLPEGTVIVSTRATIGRVTIADNKVATNQGFKSVKPKDCISEFVAYYLKSIENELIQKGRTTTYPEVNKTQFKNTNIPVPSVQEQKKIVEKLNKVFNKIKEIENAQEKAEEVRSILLESAIHHKYQNLEGEEKKLGEVVKILMGSSPPGETYNEDGEGKPFIQGASKFGEKYPSEGKFTTEPERLCKEGDVLITIRAGVGDLNIADKEYCIGRGVAGLRPQETSRDYLYFYLKGMKNYWEKVSSGSTYKSITKKDLKNAPVTIVSKDEQKEVVNFLRKIEDIVMKLTKDFEKAKEKTESLSKSILAEAFKGDLVEYDSKNESKDIQEEDLFYKNTNKTKLNDFRK